MINPPEDVLEFVIWKDNQDNQDEYKICATNGDYMPEDVIALITINKDEDISKILQQLVKKERV